MLVLYDAGKIRETLLSLDFLTALIREFSYSYISGKKKYSFFRADGNTVLFFCGVNHLERYIPFPTIVLSLLLISL
jgi:hypothetical protein